MSPFLLLVLLSLASYRLARFLIADELIAGTRIWVSNRLRATTKDKLWRRKLVYLIGCPYCVTFYTSLPLVLITERYASIPLPVLFFGGVWGASLAWWRFIEND